MPVGKICKVTGGAILLFLWLPLAWLTTLLILAALATDSVLGDFGTAMGTHIRPPQTVDIAIAFIFLSMMLVLIGLPVLSAWLFVRGNPLERLLIWLAGDSDELHLASIILRERKPAPMPEGPTPPERDFQEFSHPDEKYLPPEYRVRVQAD